MPADYSGSRMPLKGHLGKKLPDHLPSAERRPPEPVRTDPLFEIGLQLRRKGSREAALALYRQLKAAILDGRLRAGTRLPATRRSQAYFQVSRNTAVEVYERLLNEGYLLGRRGSGTYVADRAPEKPLSTKPGAQRFRGRLNPVWAQPELTGALGFWRDAGEPRPATALADFRPAMIDARLFPFDVLRRVLARQLRGLETKPARYKSPQGNPGNYHLREAIARHIALTRAVVCKAEDLVVTAGAQQAFDLLARVLVTPGQTVVALEDPGYPPMRAAFAAAGARLAPVPVDGEGLVVERLPADAGVICVCPSHQFPLGVSLSPRRRQALLEFARRRGAVIVEDDYDGEFRYQGAPLEALRTAAAADTVFYVGTFSKCMLPALRLGYLVAPPWALPTLVTAKNCLDWHCPTPVQLGVGGFIAGGHLARHVRRMRAVYGKRRDLLLRLLDDELGASLEVLPSHYGMHLAALARRPLDLERAAESLRRSRVNIHTLARYHYGPQARAGLVFGYGTVDLGEIEKGVGLVRKALAG
jgi:GntR family transcriptional regulator/MocR family aminotransferase